MLFISPWIVGFRWFQLYPILASLYYSLTNYNMMQPPIYVGFDNYTRLFAEDDLFRKALTNTAIYRCSACRSICSSPSVFALLLNLNIPGRAVFRTAFYFPGGGPQRGDGDPVDHVAEHAGRPRQRRACRPSGSQAIPWLTNPNWTMPSLILLSVWGIGPSVVIFLAGLQDIPRDLYDAAQLDGAGPLRLVRDVTMPMLSPVILFNLVIGIIGALQVFAQPFILFGGSASQDPAVRSTRC